MENPILLDPFIPNWTSKLCSKLLIEKNESIIQISCEILYQLCKVKGHKSIRKKHKKTLLSFFSLVKYFPNSVIELPKIFEKTKEIIDSTTDIIDWNCRYIFLLWISLLIQCPFNLKKVFRPDGWDRFYSEFIEKIVRDKFLSDVGGKELQAASILLASLLKRPSESVELEDFLDWSLKNYCETSKMGILTTLVQLVKAADDQILLPHYEKICKICEIASLNSNSSTISTKLLLKLKAKIVQLEIKIGKPVQLSEFISYLKNRDTILRWTAAKCIRRIVETVSNTAAKQVSIVLFKNLEQEFNTNFEVSPHSIHGFFLAIGQLLNYRLIESFDERFPDLIIKGLKFDQIKGSYAVGSFVRDAACYVTWSLARYNNHLISESHDHKIIAGLTCMALFDREVAGRRAASAALQEFIGRIGGDRQFTYLQILTHVHFFSVAALEKSFRSNALEISKELPQLVPDLINHLLQVSLFNFDKNVRKLAAETLGELYTWDQDLPKKLVEIHQKSDDLFAIHGALLAMASLPRDLVFDLIIEISLQADRIPPKSLGADLLLEGHLKLIAAIAIKNNFSDENLKIWLQTITTGLKSRSDDLRQIAILALEAISFNFGDHVDQFYLSCLTGIEKERDVNYQKGLLSALSTCPESFFSKNGSVVIKLLLKTAKTILPINDIEKRCVAIEAIEQLLKIYKSEIDLNPIKECVITSLLCDYSIDTRGDVGSKIRLAALKLAGKVPKCPEIDDLILEQAFARLDRLRTPAIETFFPNDSIEIEEFACKLMELPEIPLRGAFRGLIFSCGGLDPEMTRKTTQIIKQLNTKWGSGEFKETALSSLSEERLCIPSIQTICCLFSSLSADLIELFCQKLIDEIIPKSSNIRKLIPAFNLLIQANPSVGGKFTEFLIDQSFNHKFPAIRQLIQNSNLK